jgi:hypothetical protein
MVDGRVQSLAPVVVPSSVDSSQEDTEDYATAYYCMSINGNVAMESAGSAITLEPCDSQNMLQQGLQSYGTVHPFVYSLQHVWGYLDVVELAYAVGRQDDASDNEPVVTVSIYNQWEEKVHSLQGTTVSGILSFPVSDLMGEDDDSTTATIGEYMVKLETEDSVEYTVAFSVSEEPHVADYSRHYAPSSLAIVGISMAAVGLIVCCILLATLGGEQVAVVEKMEDTNADAAETLSQATCSNDSSNDDTEVIASDQA